MCVSDERKSNICKRVTSKYATYEKLNTLINVLNFYKQLKALNKMVTSVFYLFQAAHDESVEPTFAV